MWISIPWNFIPFIEMLAGGVHLGRRQNRYSRDLETVQIIW